MSATRTGKEKRDDLSKRRTLTKLGVDSSQRQNGKSAKSIDKAVASELQLASTPVNSCQPDAAAATTGCQSALHLDSARRRTEVSVSKMNEETPKSVMGARRSATEFRTPDCFNTVAFETPVAQLKLKKTCGEMGVPHDDFDLQTLSSSVTVAVRVRPFMMR